MGCVNIVKTSLHACGFDITLLVDIENFLSSIPASLLQVSKVEALKKLHGMHWSKFKSNPSF